jgi:hypothetical protein
MASPKPEWKSQRGDAWWWSDSPDLCAMANAATRTLEIGKPNEPNPQHLWLLIRATRDQFPDLTIWLAYDAEVRKQLDSLQDERLLRWSNVDNPYSHFAEITINDPKCKNL